MREETGTRPAGVFVTKSRIPWRCGCAPVAIVVQMTGERIGWIVLRAPYAPSRRSRAKCGSLPSRTYWSTS
jgi:hypothetical protein